MATIVEKTIGTGGDYATISAWFAASPANYTLNESSVTGAGSTASAIQLDAAASATANAYVGNTLSIAGETRLITAYNNTTKVATVGALNGSAAAFSAAPAAGVAYAIGDVVWRGLLKKQEFSSASSLVNFTGKTVSATCYPELTTEAGASWKDDPGAATNPWRYDATKGAAIKFTGATGVGVLVGMQYVRLSKLQIMGTAAAGPLSVTTINCDVGDCIIESSSTAATGTAGVEGNSLIHDSVIIQRSASTSAFIARLANGARATNCTLVSLVAVLAAGINTQYAAATLTNVYVGGVTAPENGVTAASKVNCYSSAAATGYSSAAMSTANFVNVTDGTHDFRLVSGSVLINASGRDVGGWEYTGGDTPPADTTAPTFPNGSAITAGTVTTSSVAFSYPAATDNVAVGGYEKSKDGGTTWEDNGTALSGSFAGLAAGTAFEIRVRAYDTANPRNPSAALAATISTSAAAAGTFKSRKFANNTGTGWPQGTAVAWEWHQGGRIGTAPTSVTRGTGTLAADGTLTINGCPAGAGRLFAAIQGATAADDKPFYEPGTVA